MNKVYVDVVAEFRKDGQLVPIFFTWEDGRKYSIDRILKIERCASRKAGGVGMMYTCMIQGQESHLFYEVDKRPPCPRPAWSPASAGTHGQGHS